MSTKTVAIIAVIFVGVLLLPLVLAAVNDKVSMANYEKVQMNMSYEQVKGILGDGESKTLNDLMKEGGAGMPSMPALPQGANMPDMNSIQDMMNMKIYVWKKGDDKSIVVSTVNDQVFMKAQEGFAEEPSYEMGNMQNLMQSMPAFNP